MFSSDSWQVFTSCLLVAFDRMSTTLIHHDTFELAQEGERVQARGETGIVASKSDDRMTVQWHPRRTTTLERDKWEIRQISTTTTLHPAYLQLYLDEDDSRNDRLEPCRRGWMLPGEVCEFCAGRFLAYNVCEDDSGWRIAAYCRICHSTIWIGHRPQSSESTWTRREVVVGPIDYSPPVGRPELEKTG